MVKSPNRPIAAIAYRYYHRLMTRLRLLPWGRISAESAIIVASILLAFAIDAWWQDRKTQAELQEGIVALRQELIDNLSLIETELSYREAALVSARRIVTTANSAESLTPERMDFHLGNLVFVGRSALSEGALQSILQDGLLAEVADGELRRLLAGLPARYEFVRRFEESSTESIYFRFEPYINVHGSFNQLANATATTGRPGTGEFKEDPNYVVPQYVDHTELLQSNEFLGIVTQEAWQHGDVAGALQRLKETLEQTITLIDRQNG